MYKYEETDYLYFLYRAQRVSFGEEPFSEAGNRSCVSACLRMIGATKMMNFEAGFFQKPSSKSIIWKIWQNVLLCSLETMLHCENL